MEEPLTDIIEQPAPLAEIPDLSYAFETNEVFHSRGELFKWVQDVGKTVGTVVVVSRSDNQQGKTPRLFFGCERGGKYRGSKKEGDDKLGDRQTSTKRCECPFSLRGIKLPQDDQWMVTMVCGIHNHPIVQNFEGHSFVGRLSTDEKIMLDEMSKIGARPRNVLRAIKERDEHNASTLRTIYNARARMRLIEKAGRSLMQQLLKKLVEHEYIEWHRTDEGTNQVTDLFWAHPESIQLAKCFPNVFLMDCTYKTNHYKMPLLEIVGVTSTDMSFSLAFVYLDYEKEDNYTWALERMKSIFDPKALPTVIVTDMELGLMNAIKRVFPESRNFLCRYHISKNVLAKCKNYFEVKEEWDKFIGSWNDLVFSSSDEEYVERLSNFEMVYSKHHLNALLYVKDTWLTPYKEAFVAAWTDQFFHFGNTTSNRAESAHARLKRMLGSLKGNFGTSWDAIDSLFKDQFTEIKASFERSLHIVMHDFRPMLFKELRGFVSRSALDHILTEVKRADSIGVDVQLCGCVLRRTHGLPCAHEITLYKLEGRPIPLSCIHPHWKKLSSISSLSTLHEHDCFPEVLKFMKTYENAGDAGKIGLLRKLRELAESSTTTLEEPEAEVSRRGRPHNATNKKRAKVDLSTKRDTSEFEIVLSLEDKQSENQCASL